MANLSHLLGKKSSEIEKPKPFPVGHYLWVVTSFAIIESSKKKTPGIEFELKMLEAKDDVDEDELALVKNPNERKKRMQVWITEDSLWRLTELLVTFGVDDPERTLEELIPETVGCQFVAAIMHEPIEGTVDVFDKINEKSITAAE